MTYHIYLFTILNYTININTEFPYITPIIEKSSLDFYLIKNLWVQSKELDTIFNPIPYLTKFRMWDLIHVNTQHWKTGHNILSQRIEFIIYTGSLTVSSP